jgi:UDP-glucose 4-epimerase
MRVIVTGGAGYIGSFVTRLLQDDGHSVVVIDNLSYGHREAISAPLEVVDLSDVQALDEIFRRYQPTAVMHLAASIEVNESVLDPGKYFVNNTANTALLLDIMARHHIKHLVFSSTAAVYGEPDYLPIPETAPTRPTSPYGASKLLTELSLPWYTSAYGLRSITLRYFNAAGAALDGSMGEDHEPATHLITVAIQAALGQRSFTLFGNDYPTPDGTCIRDYIHVLDIARAHLVALDYLHNGGESATYNVGTGHGYSNWEVIEAVKRVSGVDFPVTVGPRRAGDPAQLVADPSKLERELGWRAQYSDLETIVASSWRWHSTHPYGYQSDRALIGNL